MNEKVSSAGWYEALSEHDSIRLLELEPSASPEAELRGRLIPTNIREREADIYKGYIAISYVWGNPSPTSSITLDGRPFPLTASLDAALRGVRDESAACRVWADALCINQADVAERNRQVRLMGSIYSLANHTVIYLGPLTPAAEWVLRSADTHTHPLSLAPWKEGQEETKLMDPLRDVFDRPWFTRTWILQELVLSRDPLVQCGRLRTRWSRLCSFLSQITEGPPARATRVLRGMEGTRLHFQLQSDASLLQLLSSRRGIAATDPRDMVYALLGILCKAAAARLPEDFVDYSLPVEQVYIRTARHLVKSSLDLEVWRPAAAPLAQAEWSALLAAADDGIPAENKPRTLPSWVPDWELAKDMEPLPAPFSGGGTSPGFGLDLGRVVNDGRPWGAVVDDGPPILVCQSYGPLFTLEAVGPVFPPLSVVPLELLEPLRTELWLLDAYDPQYKSAQRFVKALINVCNAGQAPQLQRPLQCGDRERDPSEYSQSQISSVLDQWFQHFGPRFRHHDAILKMVDAYVDGQGGATSPLRGRRLGVLRRLFPSAVSSRDDEPSTMLGVVPCGARPGDQCLLLLPSSSLYVVRREQRSPSREWEQAILHTAQSLRRGYRSTRWNRQTPTSVGTWGRLMGECYVNAGNYPEADLDTIDRLSQIAAIL